MKKIIVIGAGAAGIRTAHNLSKKGVRVLLLEAEDRYGGRVKNETFVDNEVVEVGANWISGLEGRAGENPVWELAKHHHFRRDENDFLLAKTAKNNLKDIPICVSHDGKDLTDEYHRANYHKNQVLDSLEEKYRVLKKCNGISVMEAFEECGYDITNDVEQLVIWKEIDQVAGVECNELSSFHHFRFDDDDFTKGGVFVRDQRGFAYLFSSWVNEFMQEQAKYHDMETGIRFNQLVNCVSYENENVLVTTRQGAEFKADAVVLTVSLGVLSSSLIKFHPPIPDWKREALDQMGMGSYSKIYASFAKPFWGNSRRFYIATPTRGYYSWWLAIGNHQHHHKSSDHNYILMTSLVGEQSKRVSKLSQDEIKLEIQSVLSNAFPILREKYGSELFLPNHLKYTSWDNNELYLGAYSYAKVHALSTNYEDFYRPLQNVYNKEPCVYFAGEAFARGDTGYVHSAILSANEVSHQIVKSFQS